MMLIKHKSSPKGTNKNLLPINPLYEDFSFVIVPNWRLIQFPYFPLKKPLKGLFV